MSDEATTNVLAAMQRFKEIGDDRPTLYAIGCVVAIRRDRLRPSDEDVLHVLGRLVVTRAIRESTRPRDLMRHFSLVEGSC